MNFYNSEILNHSNTNGSTTMKPAVLIEQQRATSEIESALTIAQKFPRNIDAALKRIIHACSQKAVAEKAFFSYPRGGNTITGESVHLARIIAQQWGNIQFGIIEISQEYGYSNVRAFAWDIETNTLSKNEFIVKHARFVRGKGNVKLEDPRDIYEMIANQGARRLRNCIFEVVPIYVKEAASLQCEKTLKEPVNNQESIDDTIKKMISAFDKNFGVTALMIENKLNIPIANITEDHVNDLRKIYNSLKEGMSTIDNWFETLEPAKEEDKNKQIKDAILERLNNNKGVENQ